MQWMWLAPALLLGGCTEPPPSCITVDTACAPLYVPTFDNVFATTISKSCGADKGTCHSRTGAAGMSLADEQTAYDNLLAGHVMPGDPGCSEIVVRTSSPGKVYQMPKGGALIPSERCAILQWVLAGAHGPGVPAFGAVR